MPDVFPFTDLMLDIGAWSSWSHAITPLFRVDPHGGPGDGPALIVAGNQNPLSCGCWQIALKGLCAGNLYRVEVVFKTEGVALPGKCVRAILTVDQNRFYAHLDAKGMKDGWHRLQFEWRHGDGISGLTLRLFLAWASSGLVKWGDVRLYDLTGKVDQGVRSVRLAAVSGNPQKPESPAQCVDFYCQRIASIPGAVDLICLPELINVTRLPGDSTAWAEPVPGPTSERLSEAARERGTYIAASILESQGDAVYNTGLLVDRNGGLVGKYRKTHLTLNEGLLCGYTPGNALPVFHTDFGVVAYMICYDGHFPEVARLLSLQGAEVILLSNMGDGREGGSVWESVVRTRAVDNQIHIVAAVNSARSCIVSPKGDILYMTDRTPGSVAVADCNLDDCIADFTGRPIYRRYDQLRRADLFGDLGMHMWQP